MRLTFRKILNEGHDDNTYRQFLRHKEHGRLLPAADYLRDEWRWGSNLNVIYMPHRGPNRLLTGVKFRGPINGVKWSLAGSHYPHLYGSWRDHGHEDVFVAEGETDTGWAAWSLRDRPFDVFGLASGTAQLPTREAGMLLQGRRVWLALDPDDAGTRALERWQSVLPCASSVSVPAGEDLLSCGIPVIDLLEDS
jgi:hypothetical protein